ncbi:hypothetical protein [Marinifilum flexuosum]|uniref:hypothetical protein n=1 Tax=Marinifilum flexuosum TaxID=1117708 RepID=UPI002494F338|nr:hypothetical protein [Marinifilum flexuosum]
MPRKKIKKRKKKNNQFAGSREGRIKLGGLNDFSKRFEELSEIANCKEACKLLSKKNKALMYFTRLHLTQPRVDKGEPIDKNLAKMLFKIFKNQREDCHIELIEGKKKISINDMFIIDCLIAFIEHEEESSFLDALKTGFKPLIDAFKKQDPPTKLLYEMYDNILAMMNDFGRNMFSIKTSLIRKDFPSTGIFHIVKIKHHRPIKRNIVIKGKRRPIVKFGWPTASGKIWFFTIKADRIKDIYKGAKKELDVYIQSHAIRRFEERTKPLPLMYCRLFMANRFRDYYISFVYQNNIFLPVKYGLIKIGYFVGDIIDEKVIIKTFLFVTHHSTPEGKSLEELSGLAKKDITYWHFDSLEVFLSNPPEEGSLIKEIMSKAGVDQLFALSNLKYLKKKEQNVDWADVEDYIEKGREERLKLPEEEYEEIYS